MRAHARARFAKLTYLRAVAAIRAEPMAPALWSRLLRAARNLEDAMRQWERERLGGGWRARAPSVNAEPATSSPATRPGPRSPGS